MLYMAGGDHLPWKLLPVRQVIGPRPPVPPMPTANFFTLGRIMMQSAFASTLAGMSLVPTIACNTVVAFRMVSSSLDLSAPNRGRLELTRSADVSKLSTTALLRGIRDRTTFRERKHTRCREMRRQGKSAVAHKVWPRPGTIGTRDRF